jgi:hypothetical protein
MDYNLKLEKESVRKIKQPAREKEKKMPSYKGFQDRNFHFAVYA